MAAWISIALAAALGQAEPAAPATLAPAGGPSPEAAATAAGPVAGGVEAGAIVAPGATSGELMVAGHIGLQWSQWSAGPLRAVFRLGLMGGGSGGRLCKRSGVQCGASGFYGGVTGAVVLERRRVAPWLEAGTSAFFLLADDWESRFAGAELARIVAGVDFPWRSTSGWLGVFASASYTTVSGHPPPLADTALWMWGGGLRFVFGH